MCPACITTLAVAIAGTGSAGGLTALVVSKTFRRHRTPSREPASPASPARPVSRQGGAP